MLTIYPFTAIVGQERMKRALILNAVDTRVGGVLIRGERGTAKSTAARALAALLPNVRVVDDCRFACDPENPAGWCTECRERHARASSLFRSHTRHVPRDKRPHDGKTPRVDEAGVLAVRRSETGFPPVSQKKRALGSMSGW